MRVIARCEGPPGDDRLQQRALSGTTEERREVLRGLAMLWTFVGAVLVVVATVR